MTLCARLVSRTEALTHRHQTGCNAQALADALTVTDIGITPQDLPKLFQRYSQLDAGRQRQGTGPGLSLVKGFAELHGGTVMVERVVGGDRESVCGVVGCS